MYIILYQNYGTNEVEEHELARIVDDDPSTSGKIRSDESVQALMESEPGHSYTIEYTPVHTSGAGENESLYDCFVYYEYQ